jgi:hypothetical protein
LPFLVLFLLLCFLFPVAVYCWILAMVNRRAGPLMVSGPWDVVGLLFAASGFLLVVGPAIITGLYNRALRELPAARQPGTVAAILWDLIGYQWGVWLGYYVLVVAGGLLLLVLRRRKTVVYNVDPAALETVLTRTLARLGLPWTRQGNRIRLGQAAESVAEPPAGAAREGALAEAVRPGPPPTPRPETRPVAPAVLDLEPFGLMYNVTLHWRGRPGPLRNEVETELGRELAEVRTDDNPASAWLVGIAGCLFGLMFFAAVVLIVSGFLGGRR